MVLTLVTDSEPNPWLGSGTVDALLWALTAAILAAIVTLSLGPAPPTGGFSLADKLWHAAAYAALTSCLLLALVWRPGKPPGRVLRRVTVVAASALLLGILLEIGQRFTGRDTDWRDAGADAVGGGPPALSWVGFPPSPARPPARRASLLPPP